jgi:hypothetical protein
MTTEMLYLHVGTPKTGTSSLQVDLYDERAFYARPGVSLLKSFLRGYAHHFLAEPTGDAGSAGRPALRGSGPRLTGWKE